MSNVDEFMALLEELKKVIEENGGSLPSPKANPEFYARLQAFLDLAKEEGIKMTIKEVAERLGVPYATLRAYLLKYRRAEMSEEPVKIETPTEEPVSVDVAPKPKPEKGGKKKAEVKERPESPITLRTEMRIAEAVKRYLGKKAETLTKEEVEKLIAIGKRVRESYEKLCYNYGYEDVIKCLDDAFVSLFDIVPEYEELKERYETLKSIAKELARLAEPTLAKLYIIEEASKFLMPEDILELIEDLEEEEIAQLS